MKRHDLMVAMHDNGSRIVGTFQGDNGDAGSPPSEVTVAVEGIKASSVVLLVRDWEIKRMLPTVPGSLVRCADRVFVLMEPGNWQAVDGKPGITLDALIKEHVVLYNAAFAPPA